jgi:hypothetical protein
LTQYALLDPSTVRRMLERTLYDSAEEREAELLASEIGPASAGVLCGRPPTTSRNTSSAA